MTAAQRATAADACLRELDTELFRALCEPSRLQIIAAMIRLGPADVGDLAAQTPLDRSVVSRHLQVLQRAGLAGCRKEGRRMIYELDGPAIFDKLGSAMAAIEPLVPLCCPGSSAPE